jgi:hypothetical protein
MGRLVGYGGQVDCPGAIAGVRAWSIDYVANVEDTSGYDTDQPKTFLPTQTEWSGTFEGFKDGAPLAIGTVLAAEFKESATATQKWTGNIYITAIRPSSSVSGMTMYSYDFQGTSTLTVPTA